jgi:hypothetical protein
MSRKSNIAPKIQLIANRVRCHNCHADGSEAVFLMSDEVIFRSSALRPSTSCPVFIRGNPKKMRINRCQMIVTRNVLLRVCLVCGSTRRTGIPEY